MAIQNSKEHNEFFGGILHYICAGRLIILILYYKAIRIELIINLMSSTQILSNFSHDYDLNLTEKEERTKPEVTRFYNKEYVLHEDYKELLKLYNQVSQENESLKSIIKNCQEDKSEFNKSSCPICSSHTQENINNIYEHKTNSATITQSDSSELINTFLTDNSAEIDAK